MVLTAKELLMGGVKLLHFRESCSPGFMTVPREMKRPPWIVGLL